MDNKQSKINWIILALLTAINTFGGSLPNSCMPVLFAEIARDLNLTLVQIGTVWGVASLAGIFISIFAGVLSDRFGFKFFLGFVCILVGITGALRGMSTTYLMLVATVFVNGIVRLMVPLTVSKAVGTWFRGNHMGLAMGLSTVGIGFGLMIGPIISETVVSPWLGGWRQVLYLYGTISILMGILWLIFSRKYRQDSTTATGKTAVPLSQAFPILIRNKNLWLVGIALLSRNATITGFVGYLPLYLHNRGWDVAAADGTLSAFFTVSTISVVPLTLLSDKLGSRKAILYPAAVTGLIGISLIPFVDGNMVWLLVITAGIFMDCFMALILTMLLESEGMGTAYSGVALGIVFTLGQVGGSFSPPLGNSLAGINQAMPFLFWASISIITIAALAFNTRTGKRPAKVTLEETV